MSLKLIAFIYKTDKITSTYTAPVKMNITSCEKHPKKYITRIFLEAAIVFIIICSGWNNLKIINRFMKELIVQ